MGKRAWRNTIFCLRLSTSVLEPERFASKLTLWKKIKHKANRHQLFSEPHQSLAMRQCQCLAGFVECVLGLTERQ